MNEEESALVKETLEKIRLAALVQCHQNAAKGNFKQAEKAISLAERVEVQLRSMEAA